MSTSSQFIDGLLQQADVMLTRAIARQKVAGFGIGIVYEDKVIYTKGFGLAKIAPKRAVTTDTIFRAFSISKTFTAIGLMQLMECLYRGCLSIAGSQPAFLGACGGRRICGSAAVVCRFIMV